MFFGPRGQKHKAVRLLCYNVAFNLVHRKKSSRDFSQLGSLWFVTLWFLFFLFHFCRQNQLKHYTDSICSCSSFSNYSQGITETKKWEKETAKCQRRTHIKINCSTCCFPTPLAVISPDTQTHLSLHFLFLTLSLVHTHSLTNLLILLVWTWNITGPVISQLHFLNSANG